MSFSAEVKEELAKHISPARHCQMAELSAMLHYAGQYGLMEDGTLTIGFQSENEAVLRKGFTLLKKAYNIDTVIGVKGQKKADLLAIMGDLSGPADTSLLKQACCRRAFIRGAFLSCGSISDPTKGYHLEFVCNYSTQAELLQELIGQFEIAAKIGCRKTCVVVYVKEGAGIVELLNIMEAHVALMNLENLRILKEMRNSINRRVNCEAANIQKTVQASTRQVEDIIYLRDYYGFSRLPDNLREMAEVRLAYPEAALKELGEYLSPPVGKSGVNHRLRKLSELAEKLRS